MTSKTRPYRNQHVQLAHLEAALTATSPAEKPAEAIAALSRLRGVLIVHLYLETGLLYPWMLQRASGPVCEKVRRHRDGNRAFLASFLEFCAQWSTAAGIAGDPQAFVRDWTAQRALLFVHMAAEPDDLYDIADEYADARLPIAS